jgi:FixJ family two-component response regulator
MSESASIVHLVDDDSSFLLSVSRLLRASGFAVKCFSTAEAFLGQLASDPVASGCVIVDLQMPGLSGLDLQEQMAKSGHLMPVIFLTGHGDIPSTVRAMRGGAEDFLTKRASKQELLDAVNRALSRDKRERAERARLAGLRERFDALTEREREVLAHVVQGKLNKQIAADLAIHERTVKLHRTGITTKLQVRSVAELTRLAQEAGVLQPPATPSPKGSSRSAQASFTLNINRDGQCKTHLRGGGG